MYIKVDFKTESGTTDLRGYGILSPVLTTIFQVDLGYPVSECLHSGFY